MEEERRSESSFSFSKYNERRTKNEGRKRMDKLDLYIQNDR